MAGFPARPPSELVDGFLGMQHFSKPALGTGSRGHELRGISSHSAVRAMENVSIFQVGTWKFDHGVQLRSHFSNSCHLKTSAIFKSALWGQEVHILSCTCTEEQASSIHLGIPEKSSSRYLRSPLCTKDLFIASDPSKRALVAILAPS